MKSKVKLFQIGKEEEQEMPEVICPSCYPNRTTESIQVRCTGDTLMRGIITCLSCGRELPFEMYKGYITKLDKELPAAQSDRLETSAPNDIRDDVQESERCNYYHCYKACVTMCRRALQLGLIDKGIPDGPLGGMLKQAKVNRLLSQEIYDLATSIKGYGDIGAHRREILEPEEVNMVIYATVRMLNELFS
jgi:hypothetical protein